MPFNSCKTPTSLLFCPYFTSGETEAHRMSQDFRIHTLSPHWTPWTSLIATQVLAGDKVSPECGPLRLSPLLLAALQTVN